MRKFRLDKLVRDKIVENIVGRGNHVDSVVLTDEDLFIKLKNKLVEEVDELNFDRSEENISELADLQETIDHLASTLHISKDEIADSQQKKTVKAGSFLKGLFIKTVELKDDDPWVDSYIKKGFEEL